MTPIEKLLSDAEKYTQPIFNVSAENPDTLDIPTGSYYIQQEPQPAIMRIPDTDIVARLAEALKMAVGHIQETAEEAKKYGFYNFPSQKALAKINAIAEGK